MEFMDDEIPQCPCIGCQEALAAQPINGSRSKRAAYDRAYRSRQKAERREHVLRLARDRQARWRAKHQAAKNG